MKRVPLVAGIDLSLTGLGLVSVPFAWGGDWSLIARATFGFELKSGAPFWDQIRRLDDLCELGVRWIEQQRCTHAFVEHYPMGGGTVFGIDRLAELGGALKVQLARELSLFASPVPLLTGRSTAVGTIPRGLKAKPYVREVLLSVGMPPDWTLDEMDAFVAANHGLSLMPGGFALVAPRYQKPAARKASDVEELIR